MVGYLWYSFRCVCGSFVSIACLLRRSQLVFVILACSHTSLNFVYSSVCFFVPVSLQRSIEYASFLFLTTLIFTFTFHDIYG